MDPNIKKFLKDAAYDFTVNTAFFLLKQPGKKKRKITMNKKRKRIAEVVAESVSLPKGDKDA